MGIHSYKQIKMGCKIRKGVSQKDAAKRHKAKMRPRDIKRHRDVSARVSTPHEPK